MLCTFNGQSLDFIPSDAQDGAVGILASPYVDNNRVVYRWEGRWYAVTEPPAHGGCHRRCGARRQGDTYVHPLPHPHLPSLIPGRQGPKNSRGGAQPFT